MKLYKSSDIPKILSDLGFYENGTTYRMIVGGCVIKDGGILTVTRLKEDDPFRYGELTMPQGGLKVDETPIVGGTREVKEETSVETFSGDLTKFAFMNHNNIIKNREKVVAVIEPNGNTWFRYKDSEKGYCSTIFDLKPKPFSEPDEIEAESGYPHYEPIKNALGKGLKNYTPMNQIFLEMVAHYNGVDILREGDMITEPVPIENFLNWKCE